MSESDWIRLVVLGLVVLAVGLVVAAIYAPGVLQ